MTTRLLAETGDALLAETGTDYLVLDLAYVGTPSLISAGGRAVAPVLTPGLPVTPTRVGGLSITPILQQGH